uniref:UPF0561 protein C2orf68 homolog isoform X2 n=1 Tax=Ictidomys tridecemlineatus TaxID=43179 RepID=UPI001A9FE983|nr:UPF0561 protein C2orf68 homolog isoform X2 [Ictidomys tridecemlineatus]
MCTVHLSCKKIKPAQSRDTKVKKPPGWKHSGHEHRGPQKSRALFPVFSCIFSVGRPFSSIPSSLSFWFIPTDGSTHPGNPDCEESGESSSSGGSELEPSGHQLFCLEYESDNGEVTSVIVYQESHDQEAIGTHPKFPQELE